MGDSIIDGRNINLRDNFNNIYRTHIIGIPTGSIFTKSSIFITGI